MQPKQNIVHLPVYQPGKPIEEVKKEFGLTNVIKLASNENPYGCSPKVKEAIMAEFENTSIYPDGASTALAAELSRQLGVNTDQIVFGAGSDEVILMIARAFLVKGDETIMADHTFPQYKHNVEIEGAVSVEVPLVDGVHELQGMLDRITDKTKIIWLCNPNNPTGTMINDQQLQQFMRNVPERVLVVLDEAYIEYVKANDFPDGLDLIKQYKNIITLRTFSKIYGLASLRIGYGVGHPEIIRYINQVREPFNTTRFAQAAALAALQDQEFIGFCRENNAQGVSYLCGEFERLGLRYFPTQANFIMVDVNKPAADVFNDLLRKGIIVRNNGIPDYSTMIRVTVGTPEQNQTFIRELEKIVVEAAKEA